MPGVLAIFTFVKPLPQAEPATPPRRRGTPIEGVFSATESEVSDEESEEGRQPKELKVQIIVAKNAPMEVILGFHSSEPLPSPPPLSCVPPTKARIQRP